MADVSKIQLPDSSEYNIKDYRIPGVDTTPTSGSNNVVTSGGIYTAIVENELATASALNDLNERVDNIESTVGNGSEFVKIPDYEDDQETTAAALNDLNDRINDIDDAFGDGNFVKVPDYEEDQEVITRGINDLNNRITTIEDDCITTEPFSEIDPVSIEYYTKVEIDDLLSDIEETDPIFSASPAANITASDITNWNNKTNNIGTVTQVKVGSTSYNPSSGIVSLPAYPTTLPASDVSAWAKASTKPTYTANEVGALPNTTVIPAAPGTLNTNNTTAQTANSSEALSGTVNLHKVSKTGSYNDLLNKPNLIVEYGSALSTAPDAPLCHLSVTHIELPGGDLDDWIQATPNLYLTLQRSDVVEHQAFYSDVFAFKREESADDPMDDPITVNHTVVVYASWEPASWFWGYYEVPLQVKSDWNATSGASVILNKPTIPTVEALTTSEIDTIWNNAT